MKRKSLVPYGFGTSSFWDNLEKSFNDFERFMEPFFQQPFSNYAIPRTDIQETEEEYILKMDMPGLTKENIDIKLEDKVLIVNGELKKEKKEEKENYIRVEKSFEKYHRCFNLPENTAEKIDALYKDGILELKIAKTEKPESKAKKIKIE